MPMVYLGKEKYGSSIAGSREFGNLLQIKGLCIEKESGCYDVYGLDEELLEMVPKPVLAVLFLYPLTSQSEHERIQQDAVTKMAFCNCICSEEGEIECANRAMSAEARLAKVKVDSDFISPCDTSILYPTDGDPPLMLVDFPGLEKGYLDDSLGDVKFLKKYCISEVIERCSAEHKAYASQNIVVDNKEDALCCHFHRKYA
ncbi:hypothetical protein AgCh_030889 [Apium graveolens]